MPSVPKRVVNALLALVLAIGLAPIIQQPETAEAVAPENGGTYKDLSTVSAGATISGYYKLSANASVTLSSSSGAGLNVASGQTLVLYLEAGSTLTVKGRNGSGTTPGYAGIQVPSNSTLIIAGSGTLYATGGNAGNGGSGYSGSVGSIGDKNNRKIYRTASPSGGAGGGGAGAGIGSNGGSGGSGGSGQSATSFSLDDSKDGDNGGSGSAGSSSGSVGNIFILDTATVQATGGSQGSAGSSSTSTNYDYASKKVGDYTRVIGCPGASGGGGYGSSANGIGSGGPGGGGGGAGGTAGYIWANVVLGGSGGGGGAPYGTGGGRAYSRHVTGGRHSLTSQASNGSSGGSTSGGGYGAHSIGKEKSGTSYWSGYGGNGGNRGSYGGSGTLYVAKTASLSSNSVASSRYNSYTGSTAQNVYTTLSFDTNKNEHRDTAQDGYIESSGTTSLNMYYGATTPGSITTPKRTGYTFAGYYYTDGDGNKTLVYNADGTPNKANMQTLNWLDSSGKWLYVPDSWSSATKSTLTLTAEWTVNNYTLTLDAQGGSGGTTITYAYDSAVQDIVYTDSSSGTEVSVNHIPKRAGYVFLGYYTEDGQYQIYDANGYLQTDNAISANLINSASEKAYKYAGNGSASDITLKARWKELKYDVELYSNHQYLTTIEDVTYGDLMLPSLTSLASELPELAAKDTGSSDSGYFTREHYTFLGWNLYDEQDWRMYSADTQYNAGLTTQSDSVVQVYAAWQMNDTVDVTFNAMGGAFSSKVYKPFAGDDFAMPSTTNSAGETVASEPTKDNNEFLYWTEYQDGTGLKYKYGGTGDGTDEPAGSISKIAADTTLYAQWKSYPTLQYEANGGNWYNTESKMAPSVEYHKSGTSVNLLFDEGSTPTRDGYDFVGWSTVANPSSTDTIYKSAEDAFSMPEDGSNVVLFAQWTPAEYKVSYSSPQGDVADYITWGNTNPTTCSYKTPYTFTFTLNEQVDTSGMSVTVNGVAQVYSKVDGQDNTYQCTISEPVADQTVAIKGAQLKSYTVTFNANGGTLSTTLNSYTYGTGATLPTADDVVRDGYAFKGWYENGSTEAVTEITVTDSGNKSYTAKWEAVKYEVQFLSNDGTQTSTDLPNLTGLEYGSPMQLTSNAKDGGGYKLANSNENAIFKGWSLTQGAGQAEYVDGAYVMNLPYTYDEASGKYIAKLYAVWQYPDRTITYNANGGQNAPSATTVTDGEKGTLAFSTEVTDETTQQTSKVYPTRTGYTFLGWARTPNATEADFALAAYESQTDYFTSVGKDSVKQDETLYAVWQANTYTVRFNVNVAPTGATDIEYWTLGTTSTTAAPNDWSTTAGDTQTELSGNAVTVGETTLNKGDDGVYYFEQTMTYDQVANLTKNPLGTGAGMYARAKDSTDTTSTDYQLLNFNGWDAQTESGSVRFIDGQEVKNLTDKAGTTFTFNAVWSFQPAYYVSYDANGGAWSDGLPPTATAADSTGNVTLQFATLPTLQGYDFLGWADAKNATAAEYTSDGTATKSGVSANTQVYAAWKAQDYTVTFDKNNDGATQVAGATTTQTLIYDTAAALTQASSMFEAPTGYKFSGWTLAADSDTGIDYADGANVVNLPYATDSSTGAHTITLYAQWEIEDPVTVTFDAMGGTGAPSAYEGMNGETVDLDAMETVTDDQGQQITQRKFANPTRTGYSFAGWYTDPTGGDKVTTLELSKTTGNVALYAHWTPKTAYKVDYVYGDGVTDEVSWPIDGSYYYASAVPAIDGDVDDTVTVKFEPAPTREGYKFAGWSWDADDSEADYTAPADDADAPTFDIDDVKEKAGEVSTEDGCYHLTLHAVWEANTYTIAFASADGDETGITQDSVKVGDASQTIMTLAAARALEEAAASSGTDNKYFVEPEGYEFAGWTLTQGSDVVALKGGAAISTDLSTTDGDVVTLYPVYSPKTITLTLADDNPDSSAYATVEATYGKPLNYVNKDSIYSKSGYTFEGFYTKDGSTSGDWGEQVYTDMLQAAIESSGFTEDTTLYAKWTAKTYKVTYKKLTTNSDNTVTETTLYEETLNFGDSHTILTAKKAGLTLERGTVLKYWSTSKDEEDNTAATYEANVYLDNGFFNAEQGDSVADVTLYAMVKDSSEFSVDYNANGGNYQGTAPGSTTYETDDICTVQFTYLPEWSGHTFLGWKYSLTDKETGITTEYKLYTSALAEGTAPTDGVTPSKDENGNWCFKFPVTANTTLYAMWDPAPVEVTYNDNGATRTLTDFEATQSLDRTGDTAAQKLAGTAPASNTDNMKTVYERTGYTLAGWATTASAGKNGVATYENDMALADMNLSADTTSLKLYAAWEADAWNVSLVYGNGSDAGSLPVTYDGYYTGLPTTVERAGYDFGGWEVHVPKSTGSEDYVAYDVTATSKATYYTQVDDGATYVPDALYAKWTPKEYKITTSAAAGVGTLKVYKSDDTVAKADITKASYTDNVTVEVTPGTNYTFAGMVLKVNGEEVQLTEGVGVATYSFSVTEDAKITLTADPDNGIKYTVKYVVGNSDATLSGGTPEVDDNGMQDCVTSETTALATPSDVDGFTFKGWSTRSGSTTAEYAAGETLASPLTTRPGNTVTLYGVWEDARGYSYTVQYNANGGQGSAKQITMYEKELSTALWDGKDGDAPAPGEDDTRAFAFTNEGKTLMGWSTAPTGGVDYALGATAPEALGAEGSTAMLYAVWTANPVAVTLTDSQDVSPIKSMTVEEGGSYAGLPETLTLAGYTFDGWYTKDGSDTNDWGSKVTSATPVTETAAHTLYAKWTKLAYSVVPTQNDALGTLTVDTTRADADGKYAYDTEVTVKFKPADGVSADSVYVMAGGTVLAQSDGATQPDADGNYTYTFNITQDTNVYLIRTDTTGDTYTIAYDVMGAAGTQPEGQSATVGKGVTATASADGLSKTGYTFAGWATSKTNAEAGIVAVAAGSPYRFANASANEVCTLYAVWAKYAYTVSFQPNGGTEVAAQSYAYGGQLGELPTPTREGYAFDGWFTDEGLSTAAKATDTVTADATLYAKWVENTYTVSYEANGGEGDAFTATMGVVTGGTLSDGKVDGAYAFTRAGYTLVGWSTAKGGSVDYDLGATPTVGLAGAGQTATLYAVWSAAPVEVTLDYGIDGYTPDVATLSVSKDGTYVGLPETVTREGYTFDGWYTEAGGAGTKVLPTTTVATSAAHTLYAKWTQLTCKVTVTDNAALGDVKKSDGRAEGGAYYYGDTVTVRYKPAAGVSADGVYVMAGGSVLTRSDSPDAEGYYTYVFQVTQDTNVYLIHTTEAGDTYTVAYDENGGDGSLPDSQVVTKGKGFTVPSGDGLTRSGYTFLGWAESREHADALTVDAEPGSTYKFEAAEAGSTQTLYAVWSYQQATVTFVSNGGSDVEAKTYALGQKLGALEQPTRFGYTFAGWFHDEALTSQAFSNNTVPSTGLTLYAKWTANPYTLTFSDGGDPAATAEVSATFDTPVSLLTADAAAAAGIETPANKVFKGWTTTAGATTTEYEFGQTFSDNELYNDGTGATFYAVYANKVEIEEISGDTRYETAVEAAKKAYPDGAKGIIVCKGSDFPDALTATALSGALDYPILLTGGGNATSLEATVAKAVEELKMQGSGLDVIVVGGTSSISDSIYRQLDSLAGGTTVRLAGNVGNSYGDSRYGTQMAIYDYGKANNLWEGSPIVTTGTKPWDALSIAAYSAYTKSPIFLVQADGSLIQSAQTALQDDFAGSSALVLGDSNTVSVNTKSMVENLTGAQSNRLCGGEEGGNEYDRSRYGTSAAIADFCVDHGMTADKIAFATGTNFADALVAGPMQAKVNSFVALVNKTDDPDYGLGALDSIEQYVDDIYHIRYLGQSGEDKGVPQSLRTQIETELFGEPIG